MNDRSAELLYILQAVCEDHDTSVAVQAFREDTQYGTESYFFKLSFTFDAQLITAESYNFSEAVHSLWKAAEVLGLLEGQFIID